MPNNINPAEVSKVLLDQLKSLNNDVKLEEVGTVLQISDGVARIYGLLNATASELLEFEDGTIGVYAEDGTLKTEGVRKTYSSGEDYLATPSGKNVYYVRSATIPVDGLRASYEMTLYVNSPIMGAQFSNDTYKATLEIDLASGKEVPSVGGLGAETKGEAPQDEPESAYTQYDADLSCYVTAMGGVEFGNGLLSGVYVEHVGY